MVAQIAVLHPRDTAYFDEETLNTLSRDLGPSVAENIVCRALEDLAVRLTQIRTEYAEGDQRALRKSVKSAIPILEQIGLPKMARVASDVLTCVDKGEGVALAATLCRLLRCGEMAISCAEMGMDLSL